MPHAARLQSPAEDGTDLGGSDAPAAAPQEPATDIAGADAADREEERQPAPSRLEALLDTMTDSGETPPQEQEEAKAATSDQPQDDATGQQPVEPPQTEDEDAEFLASLKSERSRNRFQELKQQAAESANRLQEMEAQVNSLQQSLHDAGMDAGQFAQTIQYVKLANSQNPEELRIARDMLQQQLQGISMRLGEDAPAVDILSQYPDLKQAVDGFELPEDKARELARFRHMQAQQAQAMQAQQQTVQQQAQHQQAVQQASQRMDAYLQSRANEVDHKAKMSVLQAHFSDPAKMQQFVATYQPQQWEQAVRWMYDNIHVAQQQPVPPAKQQPLRTRASMLGSPDPSAGSPMDRLAQQMDAMGL